MMSRASQSMVLCCWATDVPPTDGRSVSQRPRASKVMGTTVTRSRPPRSNRDRQSTPVRKRFRNHAARMISGMVMWVVSQGIFSPA